MQILSRYWARDIRSVTARNLQYIRENSGLNPWTSPLTVLGNALIAAEVVEVPPEDSWRLPYLASRLYQRRAAHLSALDLEEERISKLINSLVIN